MPAGRMDFPYHVGFFLRGYGYDPHGPVLKVAGRDIAIHKNGDIPVSGVCPQGRQQIFDGSVFTLKHLDEGVFDKQECAGDSFPFILHPCPAGYGVKFSVWHGARFLADIENLSDWICHEN
jgi:hypothetical protein